MRFSLLRVGMTRTTAAVAVALVAATLTLVGTGRAMAESAHPLSNTCDLFRLTGVEGFSIESCLRCHDGSFASSGTNHPVGMNYADAAARRRGSMMPLRTPEEVVARGVFLPDGEIRCVTCHDGRSRWRYGLAIPAGAIPRPAVNPRDRSTYAAGASQGARQAEVKAAELNGTYGVKVSPTPLCKACHALD